MKIETRFTAMLAVMVLGSTAVNAATGYFLQGYGTNTRALAGAGVALVDDPMSVVANPAAAVALPGRQFQLGTTNIKFTPKIRVDALPPPPYDAGSFPLQPGLYKANPNVPAEISGGFIIPHGALSWRLTPQWAAALSVYGNGGLNSTFQAEGRNPLCPTGTRGTGLLCGGTLQSDLSQTFVVPSLAWQPLPWLRVGGGPIGVWQAIEIRGYDTLAPRSREPENFSNNGHDHAFGYGFKGGIQALINDDLSLGLMAQSPIWMDEFDDYSGLLPEQGLLEIPPTFQAGFAWSFLPHWTVVADFQRIYYGSASITGNPGDAQAAFGDDDGPGFGWVDTNSYKIGFRFQATPVTVLRFGYAESDAPIDRDDVFYSLISQSITSKHYTGGFSHALDESNTVDFSFQYQPQNYLEGVNPGIPEQQLEVSLGGFTFDFSWRQTF